MKIGIDARLVNETGVGRYIRNLIKELSVLDTTNSFVVYLTPESYKTFTLPNSRWQKRKISVRWHTIKEQIVLPALFLKDHLDLVHIPYFTIPIFYPGKFIVTVHDLIIDHFDTGKASTLPPLLYKSRRLGYHLIQYVGLHRACKIIAVSKATASEITAHYHIDSHKIAVTYEGVDENIMKKPEDSGKAKFGHPYFLYVGNAYPHKNLEMLVSAFHTFIMSLPEKKRAIDLVLVGKDDFFYNRLRERVDKLSQKQAIHFFGEAGDKELVNLYTHARALLFPSKMEGFGLPAIEALALGCPVVASDIPVFRELFGDTLTFVAPTDENAWVNSMRTLADEDRSLPPKETVKNLISKLSWKTLASQTLSLYEDCYRL